MGHSVNGARMPYWSRGLVAALAMLSVSGSAFAAVRREGVWPEKDTAVSLDLTRVPRDKAIKRLAEAAGWSIVVHAPDGDPVDVHVKDQPASKVLDILLMDENYVANRDGSLIAITRATTAAPPALPVPPEPPAPSNANVVGPRSPTPPAPPTPPTPPTPPAPPSPPSLTSVVAPPPPPLPPPSPQVRGADRVITGDSLTIEKGETVHDVSVFGGSLKVKGTVTGDIAVMGGSVRLREGSLVMGDASVFGGSLTLEDGARVDGDVEVLGGSIKRGDKAFIGGEISEDGRKTEHARSEDQGSGGPEASPGSDHEEEDHNGTAASLAREAGSAISSMALLFVFGAVLLALAPKRMEMLKVEVAARPMRSFAMGVVGVLMSVVIVVAVCVTIIGIPFAVIGLLLALVAMWGGACAVLETAGAALLGHRTKNSYAHLAAGCTLLLFIGAIPYIGNCVFAALLLTGIGSLVSTRGAGLFPLKTPPQNNGGSVPYRSISTDP